MIPLRAFFACLLLASAGLISQQALADDILACDGNDDEIAREQQGFCDTSKICKKIAAMIRGCEETKRFLGFLDRPAQNQIITTPQVEAALVNYTGKREGFAACVSLELAACRQYLTGTPANSSDAPIGAAAKLDRMPLSVAQRSRDSVEKTDRETLAAINRFCNSDYDACRSAINGLQLLLKSTERLNTDTGFTAHFPPLLTTSEARARQLGWAPSDHGDFWTNTKLATTIAQCDSQQLDLMAAGKARDAATVQRGLQPFDNTCGSLRRTYTQTVSDLREKLGNGFAEPTTSVASTARASGLSAASAFTTANATGAPPYVTAADCSRLRQDIPAAMADSKAGDARALLQFFDSECAPSDAADAKLARSWKQQLDSQAPVAAGPSSQVTTEGPEQTLQSVAVAEDGEDALCAGGGTESLRDSELDILKSRSLSAEDDADSALDHTLLLLWAIQQIKAIHERFQCPGWQTEVAQLDSRFQAAEQACLSEASNRSQCAPQGPDEDDIQTGGAPSAPTLDTDALDHWNQNNQDKQQAASETENDAAEQRQTMDAEHTANQQLDPERYQDAIEKARYSRQQAQEDASETGDSLRANSQTLLEKGAGMAAEFKVFDRLSKGGRPGASGQNSGNSPGCYHRVLALCCSEPGGCARYGGPVVDCTPGCVNDDR